MYAGFIISGLALTWAFVPMVIGAVSGVRQSDAEVASGLINTQQRIGGAMGGAPANTAALMHESQPIQAKTEMKVGAPAPAGGSAA